MYQMICYDVCTYCFDALQICGNTYITTDAFIICNIC
jgi:hypothetical protein